MLEAAWRSYRGWAATARALQAQARSHSLWALVLTSVAAILGALAAALPTEQVNFRAGAALSAAAMATAAAVFGQFILNAKAQERWIQARATAEAIKSECYRFAAKLGDYRKDGANEAFTARLGVWEQAVEKHGIIRDAIAAKKMDKAPPPVSMDGSWYRENRLKDQMDFYSDRSAVHKRRADLLRRLGLGLGLLAGALGVLAGGGIAGALEGSVFGAFATGVAPFVAAVTTISASIVALGSIDRNLYLASSYSGMCGRLDQLRELHRSGGMSDATLVETGEAMLSAEHAAWVEQSRSTKRDGLLKPGVETAP
jgi:hypothetical protein